MDPVSLLPPEIVHHIFSYVDHQSLALARLVCRSWNAEATDVQLYQNVTFTIGAHEKEWRLRLARAPYVLQGVTSLAVKRSRRAPIVDAASLDWLTNGATARPLRRLDIRFGAWITLDHVMALPPSLVSLNLSNTTDYATRDTIRALSRLSSLEEIDLHWCRIPSELKVDAFPNLTRLILTDARDLGLGSLIRRLLAAPCRDKLTALNVASGNAFCPHGDWYAHLPSFPALTELACSLAEEDRSEVADVLLRQCALDVLAIFRWGAASPLPPGAPAPSNGPPAAAVLDLSSDTVSTLQVDATDIDPERTRWPARLRKLVVEEDLSGAFAARLLADAPALRTVHVYSLTAEAVGVLCGGTHPDFPTGLGSAGRRLVVRSWEEVPADLERRLAAAGHVVRPIDPADPFYVDVGINDDWRAPDEAGVTVVGSLGLATTSQAPEDGDHNACPV